MRELDGRGLIGWFRYAAVTIATAMSATLRLQRS